MIGTRQTARNTPRAGLGLALAISLVLVSPGAPVSAQEIDVDTGLIIGTGWQAVQGNCLRCHSSQMIVQNSGTRAVWQSRVQLMQESHGMPPLPAEVENTILDYLQAHYGPRSAYRRPPLAEHLLPVNPYAKEIGK
ncbi:MAG: hypothetical protein RQ757_09985 [Pseudomonadales bacterium]|nr:hypothetical protein [Pseudomonadales bacterium]